MASTILVAAALLGATANAIQFFPLPTHSVVLPGNGITPRPTPGPEGFAELRKRQNNDVEVVLVGPDNTCGYVSGSIGAAYTCNTKANTCVIVPAAGTTPGAVGCCDFQQSACGFRLACFDFNQVSTQSLCTGACLVDTFTVKCLSTAFPFCNTVSFPGGAVDYFCNSVNISTPLAAVTTFQGETDGRTFLTVSVTLTSGSAANPFAGLSSLTETSLGGSSTSSASSSSSAAAGGGGGAPVGAIVGGVVGGVAVIALIVLGVWLLMRRNKKDKQAAAAQQQQQHGGTGGGPGGGPPMGQSPGGMGVGAAPYGVAAHHTGGGTTFSDATSTAHQSVYDPKYGGQPYVQGYSPPPGNNGQPQQQYPGQPGQPGYGQQQMQPNPAGGYFAPGQAPDRQDNGSPMAGAGGAYAANNNRLSSQTAQGPVSPTPSAQTFQHGNPAHLSMQSFTSQPGQQGVYHSQQQQPYQPQQPTVYEAGGNPVEHHRGQMHELA